MKARVAQTKIDHKTMPRLQRCTKDGVSMLQQLPCSFNEGRATGAECHGKYGAVLPELIGRARAPAFLSCT